MEPMTRKRWEGMTKKERREWEDREAARAKKRRGGMAYESSIIDPKTGHSYTHPDNSKEAREQRLRFAEAFKRLAAGDDEAFMLLCQGKDVPPVTT